MGERTERWVFRNLSVAVGHPDIFLVPAPTACRVLSDPHQEPIAFVHFVNDVPDCSPPSASPASPPLPARCPQCQVGTLILVEVLRPQRSRSP